MKQNISIGYEQILGYVKQLSYREKERLVNDIRKEFIESKKQSQEVGIASKPNKLQKILLDAPTWTEEEYQNVLKTIEQVNKFPSTDDFH